MIQVSTQAEFRAALLAQESEIQVIADFVVEIQQNVTYSLLLHSAPSAAVHTIFKAAGFSGSLLRVMGGGALTMENLVMDGSAAGSYIENPANRTLIQAMGGSIHLGSGAVLQNNSSYQEGGGVYLSGDPSYVNALLMDGDAVIRGCNSRTSGGGLTAALRNTDDSVRLAGTALIEQNTAANGAGVYLRSYLAEIGGALSIGEKVQIRNNNATANGGGVYCSSFSAGGGASLSLLVEGEVKISSNQAASGGGIYFYSANQGDSLTLTGLTQIAENTVTGNGGGVYLNAPRDSVSMSIQDASVTDNHAGYGGGLYLRTTAGGTLEVTGRAILSGNEAAGAASGAGGGLWIQNVSGVLDVAFLNATLHSNRASANGGGFFLSNSGSIRLNVTGGSVNSNASGASGGGIFLTGTDGAVGTVAMDGVTVSANTAAATGGGLCLGSGAGVLESILDNCIISGNTASAGSGGGIWSGGSSDTLLIRSGTVITQNSSEEGNGGGVYFNSDQGVLTLSADAKITYNRADSREIGFGGHGGGICVVPGRVDIRDQVEISHNSAGKFGGGLSAAEESVITMGGGSIHDNESGQEGGGVWNHISSRFTQTGGRIENNTAQIGGGIYNDADATASIMGGVIQGNTAVQYAQGIFNAGTLYTEGLRELANGLYIKNRGAVAYLTGALAEGTVLQLENSDYVTPNLEGTPIVVGEATSEYPRLSQADANGFQKPHTGFEGWEIRLSEDGVQVLLAPVIYALRYENTMQEQNPNPPGYTVLTPTITLSPLANAPGRRFLGWFDAPEGGAQVTEIPMGSMGDKTLYARWEMIEYTVIYYGNDAEGPMAQDIPDPQTIPEGQTGILSAAIPTRAGYDFRDWNTEPDGAGETYRPGQTVGPIYAGLVLYAQWREVLHILTYHGNDEGGSAAQNVPIPQVIYENRAVPLSDAIPTREGYRFTGWNTWPDGGGIPYQPGALFRSATTDADLYAQWEAIPPTLHLLTYEANDAGGPPAEWIPYPVQVEDGQSAILSTAIPTRLGHRFLGWNTVLSGSGASYQPGQTVEPLHADLTLFAQWQRVEHTLTYYGNDAGGSAAQNIPDPMRVPDGQSVTLSDMLPTRYGFAFSEWNTDPGGTGAAYPPGGTIPDVRADIGLYARWNPLPLPAGYTLAYCGNDAGGSLACCIPCPQRVLPGQCARISCCTPCRDGYCFSGWNTDPWGSGQMVCPGQIVGPVMGNACFYAQWSPFMPPKPCTVCRSNPALSY